MRKNTAFILLIIITSCLFITACSAGQGDDTSIVVTESVFSDSPLEEQESVTNEEFSSSDIFPEQDFSMENSVSSEEWISSQESAISQQSSSDGNEEEEFTRLVIIVEEDAEAMSLLDYMKLKKYNFVADGTGFVKSINGKANASPYYWMLYTSDRKNTISSWGSIIYNGTRIYSSSKGAKALQIKPGCIYIWEYTKTQY